MIWIILTIIALGTALYLITPLVKGRFGSLGITFFMIGFVAISLGLYTYLGTPSPSESTPLISSQAPQIPLDVNPQDITLDDIQTMVDGLAEKLLQNPDDPEGWSRLIRSRLVLGDMKALINDHKAMTAHYAGDPETIEKINLSSGFSEFARSIEAKIDSP